MIKRSNRREDMIWWLCIHSPSNRSHDDSESSTLRQAQIFQSRLSPHELAYQESLIQEREAEIREIETGMHELAGIFRDLGTLVGEQGQMIGAHLALAAVDCAQVQ